MTSRIGRARKPRRPDATRRHAYTLIELLLVLTIMLIAAGMAIPMFVHSLEGTRLRSAAKSVATTHRYARGMAVLNQAEVAVVFDTETSTIRVLRIDRPPSTPANPEDPFASGALQDRGFLSSMKEEKQPQDESAPAYSTESLLERRLDPRISIQNVTGVPAPQQYKKQFWVVYQPNGMTESYAVLLAEDRGDQTSVKIEGITGQVEFSP